MTRIYTLLEFYSLGPGPSPPSTFPAAAHTNTQPRDAKSTPYLPAPTTQEESIFQYALDMENMLMNGISGGLGAPWRLATERKTVGIGEEFSVFCCSGFFFLWVPRSALGVFCVRDGGKRSLRRVRAGLNARREGKNGRASASSSSMGEGNDGVRTVSEWGQEQ